MNIQGFEIKNVSHNQYSVTLKPFLKGFGHIFGLLFRKIFLSFLSGYAISSVRISDVSNEFSIHTGFKEDIIDILNNLKKIKFLVLSKEPVFILTVEKHNVVQIVANDFLIDEKKSDIIILNKDLHIATIVQQCFVKIEIKVAKGFGYCFNNFIKNPISLKQSSGWIMLNVHYSPIIEFFFKVEDISLNDVIYENLILFFTTNGIVDPKKCVYEANYILYKQLPFFNLSIGVSLENFFDSVDYLKFKKSEIEILMAKHISELNFSIKIVNYLKLAGIFYIKDLINIPENELFAILHFNENLLSEIKFVLSKFYNNF